MQAKEVDVRPILGLPAPTGQAISRAAINNVFSIRDYHCGMVSTATEAGPLEWRGNPGHLRVGSDK